LGLGGQAPPSLKVAPPLNVRVTCPKSVELILFQPTSHNPSTSTSRNLITDDNDRNIQIITNDNDNHIP
jgi:hypothetical protein